MNPGRPRQPAWPVTGRSRDPAGDVPEDFVPLPVQYPHAFGDALGYSGQRQLVGFWLACRGRELLCCDGDGCAAGAYDAHTFAAVVAPAGHPLGVRLGAGRTAATHMFVWDRHNDAAYLAPFGSGWRFLAAQ